MLVNHAPPTLDVVAWIALTSVNQIPKSLEKLSLYRDFFSSSEALAINLQVIR